MYTQYQKGLSIVLLTSIILQSCGGNLILGHQVPAMREQPQEPTHQEPLPTPSQAAERLQIQKSLESPDLQPEASQPSPYTTRSAWKARQQRALKARSLPLATAQAGLPGGAGSDDAGAREAKQNEPLPAEGQEEAQAQTRPEATGVAHEATFTFEGKRISTAYWYEDREMSSILQAALKRYSHEVSADRTCYTQADGSTITILGPLDNLSPQGLAEALLAHQRQPGLVLIPFNLGVLHWVGLVLAYESSGKLVRAEYYDSLQKEVSHNINGVLQVHNLGRVDESLRTFTQMQGPGVVTQANGSDCGPCTIENLLAHAGLGHEPERDSVRRRYQHLQLLEENIVDERGQRYYDDLYARQQRNKASFRVPVAMPGSSTALLSLEQREHSSPSKAEEVRKLVAQRKEQIEEKYAQLLSLESTTADLQLVESLLIDLQWLLEEEETYAPEEGETSAQSYLVSLKSESSLRWSEEQYSLLIQLLDRAYGQELKRVVHPSPLIDPTRRIARLVAVLHQLAALYQEQGARKRDLSLYTDAAVLYQHVMSVCEKEGAAYAAQREAAYEGLARVRVVMLARALGEGDEVAPNVDVLQEEIDRDKLALHELREEARERVAALEEAEMNDEAAYIVRSKELFTHIAARMAAFLKRLYEESEQELGPAPCKYAVMGLGSMALKQITPYSDLEFAILIEDQPKLNKTKRFTVWDQAEDLLEEHREYFRKLSHLVHLRVINLGETVVPMSKYQVSLDHLGKKGVNFDLGGKTPLGRKDQTHLVRPYELIQPVREMVRYLKNEGQRMEHMDKLLPFILETACHVHGDRALYASYMGAKDRFLKEGQTEQGAPVYKARALQKLLEGVVEMDYKGGKAAKPKQGDLLDFAPNLGQDQHGRLYDVKQEIYRLPDRLLYRLAMYYGVLPESAWDAVLQLQEKGIINEEAAGHLQYAASFATLLRLRTYAHHGEQKEGMAVLRNDKSEAEQQQALGAMFRLPPKALQAGGSFFKYYYTALPLHKKMLEFFQAMNIREYLPAIIDQNPVLASFLGPFFGAKGKFSSDEEARFFKVAPFYEVDLRVNAAIYDRLMQRRAAIECYEGLIKEARETATGDQEGLATWLNNAGLHYEALGQTQKGLALQEQALSELKALLKGRNHPHLAGYLDNVGSAYRALGQMKEALKHHQQALRMYRALNHPDLAGALSNVGTTYHALGQTKEALQHLQEALEMFRALYPRDNHTGIAVSLNNLGEVYRTLGKTNKALKHYQQALDIRQELFDRQPHPDTAVSLNNIGLAYQALGQTQEALKHHQQALDIRQELFDRQPHSDTAVSLNNIGLAYQALGQTKKALKYNQQALNMRRELFKGQPHSDTAALLNNIGLAYQALGQTKKALKHHQRALNMRRELFKGRPHPDVASSFSSVGVTYQALGKMQKGLGHLKQALDMYKALHAGKNHPDLARSLRNVGIAYGKLSQTQKGLSHLKQALDMYKALHAGKNHPDLARSLNDVGNAYQVLGQTQKGLTYKQQALDMYRVLHAGKNHPDLARSLNDVGSAYEQLGDTEIACTFYREALSMFEQVLPAGHTYFPIIQCNIRRVEVRSAVSPRGLLRWRKARRRRLSGKKVL